MGPAPRAFRLAAAAAMLLAGAALLFARLGHYALWDDEANTALVGRGVWRTGDTTALVDGNLVAFRGGAELSGVRARYLAPLPYYLVAPFSGPAGATAFACRLPFAACGLLLLVVVCGVLWRSGADRLTWTLAAMGFLGNVSFILYCRQCRYYAPAILATAVLGILVHGWRDGRSRARPLAIAAAAVALLASSYLAFAAAAAALAVDHAVFGRRQVRPDRAGWAILCVPVLLAGGLIVSVWNPIGKAVRDPAAVDGPLERLIVFAWTVRDLNRNEFGALLALAVAPIIAWRARRAGDPTPRMTLGLAVYIGAVVLLSPQVVRVRGPGGRLDFLTHAAEMRYVAPLIPLVVAIEVTLLASLRGRWRRAAIPAGVVLFGTNLLHGGPLLRPDEGFEQTRMGLRSTAAAYVGELLAPPGDPYRAAAGWLADGVRPGETVWTLPDFTVFPLMFHAPHARYAWLLSDPPPEGLRDQPDWMVRGRVLPDAILAFGPARDAVDRLAPAFAAAGARYDAVARLDVHYRDLYRPELMWRSFVPVRPADRERDGIFVYRRAMLDAAAPPPE